MFKLDSNRPLVMGILNVTPDSFSDGGKFVRNLDALTHAHAMLDAGADLIDVGGESTRPGAQAVSAAQEVDRVCPVVAELAKAGALVSVDTSKPEVMLEAAKAGAVMINDVRALSLPGALEAAASTDLPVCLMHMQGTPQTMQDSPSYVDVVDEVRDYLVRRADACTEAGISREKICLDPGFGFGKTLEHNLSLLRNLERLCDLPYPILVGVSRKRMLGQITGRSVEERLAAGLAVGAIALQKGARILRVHDVAETVDLVKIYSAVYDCDSKEI